MTLDQYIGIPFVDLGRDFTGCDCWGLVCLFYKHEYGILLPELLNYKSVKDTESILALVEQQKKTWTKTVHWKKGDVVVMNIRGSQTHVGIYIGGMRVLHTLERVGSFLGDLKNPAWFTVNRIEGGYRYV